MNTYPFNDVDAINLAIEKTLDEEYIRTGFCTVQTHLYILGAQHDWTFLHDYLKKDGRIPLYSNKIPKNIILDEHINIRRQEILGYRLSKLKRFTKNIEKKGGRVLLVFPAERGDVFGIESDKNYVLKPVLNGIEARIIKIASNQGVAPPLIAMTRESCVELYGPSLEPKDYPFLEIPPIAKKFKLLHNEGIAYNERLTEHLVKIDNDYKLIDYGNAEFSKDFNLDFEKIRAFFGNRYETFLNAYRAA